MPRESDLLITTTKNVPDYRVTSVMGEIFGLVVGIVFPLSMFARSEQTSMR